MCIRFGVGFRRGIREYREKERSFLFRLVGERGIKENVGSDLERGWNYVG